MLKRYALATSSAAAIALVAATPAARADIPPPEGYVETCTLEKQQKPGTECVTCSAWHGDADVCDKTHASDGYRRSCRTNGASVWSEVWCRPTGDGESPVPPPASGESPVQPPASGSETAPVTAPEKSGKCTGGGLPGALAWLGAIAALPFMRRRR